jgi:thioredoxin 1
MLTILKFYSTTCAPCRVLNPILHDLQEEYPQRFNLVEINVDNLSFEKDLPTTAETYNIMSVPTLIFLKDTKEIDRLTGSISKSKLQETLKKYI